VYIGPADIHRALIDERAAGIPIEPQRKLVRRSLWLQRHIHPHDAQRNRQLPIQLVDESVALGDDAYFTAHETEYWPGVR